MPAPKAPPVPATIPTTIPPEDTTCDGLLASGTVVAERSPPVTGQGQCGIPRPIRLEAIVIGAGRRIAVEPAALLRCDLAEVLATWVREDVVPTIGAGHAVEALVGVGAYACRGRDGLPDAKLSEHATGNAVDIGAFRFDGRTVPVKEVDAVLPGPTLRTTACARFSTVLGPGSDAFHAEHIHLDLEHRRNGSHYCHWNAP